WVYRNKKDKRGIVIRNKARLVAQGHTQKEDIDYEEVFALVARIEATRLFLAYASFMGFLVIFRYLKGQPELGLWYPKDSPFNLEAYTDSDYAGASLDRKSTTGGCQLLKRRLISWQCNKQTVVANFTIKVDAKTTAWNEFSSTMVSAIICLATNQKFNFSKYIFDNMMKNLEDEAVCEEMYDSVEWVATIDTGLDVEHDRGSGPRRQETMGDAAAQTRVIALETIKTNQALEIGSLKRRVKKLEKKASKRTYKRNRLYKIGVLDDEEVMAEKEVKTDDPVTTVGEVVTTAGVEDDVQAMMDADHEIAERLQAEEQGELSNEERSKLFVKLMNQRKKHFVRLRAEEKMRKPPTKAQKRNQMCTYLKNMASFTHHQLKNKNFEEVQKAFDNTISWINSFVPIDKEVAKGSETRAEGSSKSAREELKSDKSKKQKLDEKIEAKEDNDQEEAKMKMYMKIVSDDEIVIDAIPLATKPPIINIDREDLETLWKLVKAKYGNTRPEEAYERVLWGDLKVMLEPDIESEVWRTLQGNKVTIWKLFSSCGVHFVRFQNLHIFMLVEKRYPFTPAIIIEILNRKLQAGHWNEICYQLLKLVLKQQKKK
nr:ribonuclease H-like domain, reverse transcriptase, RNA-dependent DNA polymerase [Tanacetum cinerariifolium]